ncbi:hypothetical protein JCM24511_04720 [Saitozyma sp. JCM 24511]|nr:hypothetical protein JCM24511_04720 [Saitozyma sp. JCM 24511]
MAATSTYNGIPNNTHPNWWQDPSLRKNAFWLFICALASVYAGYDGSLLNGLQALPKFFETFPGLTDSNLLGLTGAVQFLPGLVVPFAVAYVADRFGRKVALLGASTGIIVGAVIQCTSNQLGVFIASRVIIGTAGQFGLPMSATALVELAHPRIRGVASALNLCCYYIGSIIASWATFGTLQHFPESSWSWRLPSLLQALVPALILVPTFFLPESPRWLINRGRIQEARVVLSQQHANGEMDDPLVLFELAEIERAISEEKAVSGNKSPGWLDFFKTKGNRWRFFIVAHVGVGAQWNGVGIVSYYLVPVLASVGITDPTKQTLVTGGLSISNLCFAVAGAFMVERMGRRPLWFISTGGMLVCMIVVTALSATFLKDNNAAIGGAVVAFLYLFYGFYDIAWTPLNLAYPVEVLSFSLRAKGMSLWSLFGSVALCLNTWVNPIALKAIGFWYYIVYIGVLVYLLVIAYFFFPETKGLSLEEVAERFDGHSLDVSVQGAVNEFTTEVKPEVHEIEGKESV